MARGRQPGFQMGAEHRLKIANSNVFNRLMKHAEGEIDMKPTELTAAISLLDRVMPKLSSVELKGDEESPLELVFRIGGDADPNG